MDNDSNDSPNSESNGVLPVYGGLRAASSSALLVQFFCPFGRVDPPLARCPKRKNMENLTLACAAGGLALGPALAQLWPKALVWLWTSCPSFNLSFSARA